MAKDKFTAEENGIFESLKPIFQSEESEAAVNMKSEHFEAIKKLGAIEPLDDSDPENKSVVVKACDVCKLLKTLDKKSEQPMNAPAPAAEVPAKQPANFNNPASGDKPKK